MECKVSKDPVTSKKYLADKNLKSIVPIDDTVCMFYFKPRKILINTPYYIG